MTKALPKLSQITDCQSTHWPDHKAECIRPEDKPKPVDEQIGAEFVECESFEDCRAFLIKHPEVITKDVRAFILTLALRLTRKPQFSDELYQKGYMALKTHPPA